MDSPIELLAELFASQGGRAYLGEAVSVVTHMLQAGALAERAGAEAHLVAAALLHDVGHILEGAPISGATGELDRHHEQVGADWLSAWLPREVSEPVRLHVAAKRYLCAAEPRYVDRLSPASLDSLAVQGGPMRPDEVAEFERHPYAAAAVAVRRWDEQAKDPQRAVPDFDHFRPLLDSLLRGPIYHP